MILALLAATAAPAGQPTYTLDTNPIRLGNKAFEEGRFDEAMLRYQEAVTAGYQVHRARYGLAESSVRQGRYVEADSFYRQAIADQEKKGDDYPEAHAGLGLLLLRQGRTEEAALEFDAALKAKQNLWEALYGQARIFMQREQWKDARTLLDRGANRKGLKEREDLYHHGMALYYSGQGELPKAEIEALGALSLNPSDPQYGTLVARLYEQRGSPELAIDAYEKALNTPGMVPTAPMWHTLGNLYLQVQRYNDARSGYLKAVEIDSTYSPALKDLAVLYRLAGQNDRAVRAWLAYIVLEKDDVDALVGLGETYLETQQYAQAMEAARRAYAIDSTRTDVRWVFARAGLKSQDRTYKSGAARLFAGLPDSLRTEAGGWTALAAWQLESKRYAAADSSLGRAVSLEPGLADAWFQMGIVDLNMGQPEAAVAHFEKAAALEPDGPLNHLNLGIAHLQAKHPERAIPAFRRALDIDSTLTTGRLLLAQALAVTDSLEAAEQEYRHVLRAEPANARALRGLGYCHIRRAAYAKAAEAYRLSTEAEPANADGWAGLGNALLGLQKLDEAEAAFVRARNIDPGNVNLRRGMELLEKARKATSGG